jgi:hypothetical protein
MLFYHQIPDILTVNFKTHTSTNLLSAVELQLSGLIGRASQQDVQNIGIIKYFYEYRIHWQFEEEKISTKC